MAAVTVNRRRRNVVGHLLEKYYDVDIAADGDTLDTNLARIESWTARANSGNLIDGTQSGSTITFNTSGAETGVQVRAVGPQ